MLPEKLNVAVKSADKRFFIGLLMGVIMTGFQFLNNSQNGFACLMVCAGLIAGSTIYRTLIKREIKK